MSNQAFEIKENIAALEQALLENTPDMPTLLRDIHSKLKKDQALVTLLSEEECAILVNGLNKQTSAKLADAIAKGKPKKALKDMTVDDL